MDKKSEFTRLLEQGYLKEPPDEHQRTLDIAVCMMTTCMNCHFLGLRYLPLTKGNDSRLFGECPECGWIVEF